MTVVGLIVAWGVRIRWRQLLLFPMDLFLAWCFGCAFALWASEAQR